MAKQKVSLAEQHIEKIVLGISVMLFALVVFACVLHTPVTVSLQGQKLPADKVDQALQRLAERVQDAVRNAKATTKDVPDYGLQVESYQKYGPVKNPTTMPAPLAWWPELQPPTGELRDVMARHSLAPVIAPLVDRIYSGVTYAALAKPISTSAVAANVSVSPPSEPKDVAWTFLKLKFNRPKQYEKFREYHYPKDLASLLLFADVQVQRQRIYPDGSTGPWQDIQPYRTVTIDYPKTVRIEPDGTLHRGDESKVNDLLAVLRANQEMILFPVPQREEFLGGDVFTPYIDTKTGFPEPVAWSEEKAKLERTVLRPTPPRRPPSRRLGRSRSGRRAGAGARGEDERARRGRSFEDPRERGYDERRGRTRPGAASLLDVSRSQEANRQLLQAEAALEAKNLEEAKTLVDRVWGRSDLLPTVRRKALSLKNKIDPAYERWLALQQQRQLQQQREQEEMIEIWVFDMQAPAGKTCRYRARVLLFNVYCHPNVDRTTLLNPQDAGKVVLVGEWSQPSEPITIANRQWMFLTRADSRSRTAVVEVFRFWQGQWYRASFQVGVGDEIGTIKKVKDPSGLGEWVDVDFRTGLVVVDIHYSRAVPKASVSGSGVGFKLITASSPVLVCMDKQGAIEERWAVVDRASMMYSELKEKVKQAAAAVRPTVGGLLR